MDQYQFINYSHPDQQKDSVQRQKVARYIGVHFRNRSRPATRLDAGHRPNQDFISFGVVPDEDGPQALTLRRPRSRLVEGVPRDHSGVRQDPFGAYPVRQTYVVDRAIDHFINSYAPSHLIRPEIVNHESSLAVIQDYFRYALQHEVMFQATITLALADGSANAWTDGHADRDVLNYYGQSIAMLRQSLLGTEASCDDASLFAIMALMGVDYLLNDLNAFGAHLMGLRQIIHLRGGLEAVGFPSLLRPSVTSVESFWTYICDQPHLNHKHPAHSVPSAASDTIPMSLCEPNVSKMLSKIPRGYHTLVNRSVFGPKLLSIIYQVAGNDATLQHGKPTPFTYRDGVRKFLNFKTTSGRPVTAAAGLTYCGELAKMLASPELSQIERNCCIGLFIYLLGFTRSEQLSPIYFTQLQFHTQELLHTPLTDDTPEATELSAWAMFAVASTLLPLKAPFSPQDGTEDRRYALALRVVKFFSSRRTWGDMEDRLKLFIWNASCMVSWRDLWHAGVRHLKLRDEVSSQSATENHDGRQKPRQQECEHSASQPF